MEAPRFEDQPGESEFSPEVTYLDLELQEFLDSQDKERTQKAIDGFFMWHGVYLHDVDNLARDRRSSNKTIHAKISRHGNEIIENFSEVTKLVAETSDSPSQALNTTADMLSKERIARGLAFDEMRPVKTYDPTEHTPDFFKDRLLELSRQYSDPAERHAKLMELYSLDLQLTTAQTVLQFRKGRESVGEAESIVAEFQNRETMKKVAKNIGETALNAAEMGGIVILATSFIAQDVVSTFIDKFRQKHRRR